MSNGKNKNCLTCPVADMEPNFSDAPLGTEKAEGLAPLCSLHIHSVRYGLTDPDGVSGKAAIDGIVYGGVLQNDSAEFIKEVTYSQEKIKKADGPEITLIEITGENNNENS